MKKKRCHVVVAQVQRGGGGVATEKERCHKAVAAFSPFMAFQVFYNAKAEHCSPQPGTVRGKGPHT